MTSALLPGFTQFYCPARVGALLCFFAPLLAASGLEAILNREAFVGGRWARPALLLVGLLVCCAAALAMRRVTESSYFDFVRTSLPGLYAAPVSWRRRAWLPWRGLECMLDAHRRRAQALLTVVVFIDLYALRPIWSAS